jgi:hypothetical protein
MHLYVTFSFGVVIATPLSGGGGGRYMLGLKYYKRSASRKLLVIKIMSYFNL